MLALATSVYYLSPHNARTSGRFFSYIRSHVSSTPRAAYNMWSRTYVYAAHAQLHSHIKKVCALASYRRTRHHIPARPPPATRS